MKAVLLSIKPEYVCKILNKEKILEIRKTIPKCELPCKVYIYCTKQGRPLVYGDVPCNSGFIEKYIQTYNYSKEDVDKIWGNLQGKVVAEFTLNKVEQFSVGSLRSDNIEKLACLSYKEMIDYFYKPEELDGNHSKIGYAWHIDDLIIYDEPKELSDFKVYDKTYDNVGAFGWAFPEEQKYTPLKRPPQSWCYVEEGGSMKAFVIKNKEGKYFCGYDALAGINIFSERIIDGLNTQTPTLEHCVEEIKDYHLSDCEVVEITIAEGDLEKTIDYFKDRVEKDVIEIKQNYIEYNELVNEYNDLRKKFLDKNKKIKKLKTKVSEKDKEIERLKKNMEFDTAYYVKELVNVRKQVCDMARKKIVEATCYDTEEEVRNVIYDLNASTALEILDEIEKGECNER